MVTPQAQAWTCSDSRFLCFWPQKQTWDTQIGYAFGLLAFVPLADLVERRRLIIILLLFTAVVSLLVAVSPNFWWLESASILLGAVTVVPQVIVPVAADLADSHNRGRIVGIVMSGLLIGVLGARTVSGWIGGTMGWQSVYVFGAALMLVLAFMARLTFPITHPVAQKTSYVSVLRSIVPLMRDEPALVRASLTGGALFATFNAFWTTLTVRLGARPYQFDASIIGMFWLLGIAGGPWLHWPDVWRSVRIRERWYLLASHWSLVHSSGWPG